MTGHFAITWHDGRRKPTCAPNPAYPDGIDLDVSEGARVACHALLPYPARRCGRYVVLCQICGHSSVVTTAGRPDDPRSLKVACRPLAQA